MYYFFVLKISLPIYQFGMLSKKALKVLKLSNPVNCLRTVPNYLNLARFQSNQKWLRKQDQKTKENSHTLTTLVSYLIVKEPEIESNMFQKSFLTYFTFNAKKVL